MATLRVYAEQACSNCEGTGLVWEYFLDGEAVREDCPRCDGSGRAFEYVWPVPLEAAECGVEVAVANIHE